MRYIVEFNNDLSRPQAARDPVLSPRYAYTASDDYSALVRAVCIWKSLLREKNPYSLMSVTKENRDGSSSKVEPKDGLVETILDMVFRSETDPGRFEPV